MPKPPERGHVEFDPPLPFGSERYLRAWELMTDMEATRTTVIHSVGQHNLKSLNFETLELAMMFKLRF